jgi:nucleoside-diphosphate-sugar epimerase
MTKRKNVSLESRPPTAIVAGGGGFLGAALCDTLLVQNLEVFWIDDSVAGDSPSVFRLKQSPRFHHLESDITKYHFDPLMKPAYVFHLAGVEEYLSGRKPQLQTLLVNSLGTKNLLELSRLSQAKFLLISSVDIYSGYLSQFDLDTYFGPLRKEAARYSHHEAKRYAEALTFEYHQQFNVDARIVRLADVYGPGMNLDGGGLVTRLFHQASRQEPLSIEGDGLTPVRPTYVSDIIYGLVKAMVSPETKGKIYTLVNPEEVTVLNLAYLIQKACRRESAVVFVEEKSVGKRYVLDRLVLSQTQKDLGWRPKVSLEEGVEKTVEWIFRGGDEEVVPVPAAAEEVVFAPLPPAPIEEKAVVESSQAAAPKEEAKKVEKRDEFEKEKATRPVAETEEGENEGEISQEPEEEESAKKPRLPELKIKSSAPIGVRESKSRTRPRVKLRFPRLKLAPLKRPALSRPRLPALRPRLRRPSHRLLVFGLSLTTLLVVVLGPPLVFAASGLLAVYRMQNAIGALKERQIQRADAEASKARGDLARAERWLNRSVWLAGIIDKREELERWRNLLGSLREVAVATTHVTKAAPPALAMTRAILGQSDETVEDNLRSAKVEVELADDHLALAEAQLKGLNPVWFPGFLSGPVQRAKNRIPETREEIAAVRDLLQVLPRIIGATGQRTYLLLFQNNMELRPGGGFIGSFGLAKFINGRLVDLKIEDVYNADGQLKDAVVAPEPIKTYLKQPNWYLRDSNWSPHFPTNAAQAQWFIKNELGVDVDGVVAADLSLIKEVLAVLGPVELPDYQETIAAENLFEKAEYRVESDFFPGSTQKRDFLGALGRAVIQKVVNTNEGDWPALMAAAGKAAREKHLMVSFADPSLNQVVEERGLDGAVPLEREKVSGNQLRDFLMVVDANLGANKANYFVRRSVFHQVVADKDGNLAERVTIEYDNQSPADTWPGGSYTNYLRVYVTSGAVLQDVRIDNRTVPDEIVRGRELGKTVWALPITVPIKSKLSVSFDYHLSDPLVFDGGLAVYDLQVLKQAGTVDDRYRLTFDFPAFYQILKSKPKAKARDQALVFSTTLEEDREFNLEIIK